MERFNQTLKLRLLAFSDLQRTNWDETIPLCMFAYRTSVHATATGCTPAYAVYGRQLRTPLDFELDSVQSPDTPITDHVQQLSEEIRNAWAAIARHREES